MYTKLGDVDDGYDEDVVRGRNGPYYMYVLDSHPEVREDATMWRDDVYDLYRTVMLI